MNVDDLTAGLLVTVRDWYANHRETRPDWDSPFGIMMGGGSREKKRELMGTPLRVEAVSLPYVACRVAFANRVVVLDVREVELTRVTPEYVGIMRAKHEAESRKKARQSKHTNPFGTLLGLSMPDWEDDA